MVFLFSAHENYLWCCKFSWKEASIELQNYTGIKYSQNGLWLDQGSRLFDGPVDKRDPSPCIPIPS